VATKRCATVAQQLLNKKKHMPTEKKYPSYCVCCGDKPVYLKNRYSGICPIPTLFARRQIRRQFVCQLEFKLSSNGLLIADDWTTSSGRVGTGQWGVLCRNGDINAFNIVSHCGYEFTKNKRDF